MGLYAIATHSHLVIVDFDPNWRIQDYQLLSTGYHFGLALQTVGDALHLVAYRGGAGVYQQTEQQLRTYRVGRPCELVSVQPLQENWGDVHQIAWANGGIYSANTQFNQVVYQNAQLTQTYAFENQHQDWNHLNSVYPCGRQVFVMLHNRGRMESQLAVLEHEAVGFRLQQQISLWDRGCHNLFVSDPDLYYNASHTHSVVLADARRNRIIHRLTFEGWHTKGMSVTPEVIVAGLSEYTLRDRRAFSRCQLAVIERSSGSVRQVVDLSLPDYAQNLGNINELRSLSGDELGQARPEPVALDWSQVRLAQAHPWRYHLRYWQTRLLAPLRHTKRYLRERI